MNWFRSYFNSRAQKCQVNFNEALSNASVLKCGVPHGSIIGPLLFLIYINGLPNCLSSASAKMFADDTNISCVAESLSDLEPVINHELMNLAVWLIMKANKLILKIAKIEFVIHRLPAETAC